MINVLGVWQSCGQSERIVQICHSGSSSPHRIVCQIRPQAHKRNLFVTSDPMATEPHKRELLDSNTIEPTQVR